MRKLKLKLNHFSFKGAVNTVKYSSSVEFRGGNDDYNFINIFKKRGVNSASGFSSSLNVQAQTSKLKQLSKGSSSLNNRKQTTEAYDDDYTDEFTTYTKKKEVKLSQQPELNKSSVSTVSSSSSSSDSTSLSKYMMSVNTMPKRGSASHDSASRKSTHKSAHLISSASYEQHLNGHTNGVTNEENESLSSNESISSKVSSNSSSSQSTTLSLMVNKNVSKTSKQVTPPKSVQPQTSLSLSISQCEFVP